MNWQEIECIFICGELDKQGTFREREEEGGH